MPGAASANSLTVSSCCGVGRLRRSCSQGRATFQKVKGLPSLSGFACCAFGLGLHGRAESGSVRLPLSGSLPNESQRFGGRSQRSCIVMRSSDCFPVFQLRPRHARHGCGYSNKRNKSLSPGTVRRSSEPGRASVEAEREIANNFDNDFEDLRVLQEWLLTKELTLAEIVESSYRVPEAGIGREGQSRGVLPVTENVSGSWWTRIQGSVSSRVRGLLLLNVLTLLYGSNISVVKEAEELLDPATFSTGRFAFAALLFIPFIPAAFKSSITRKAGLELGIWAAFAYLAQAYGVVTTDAGRASFISSFTVIEIPILAGLFGAKIPKVTWVAAAAAIFGVNLLETTGGHPSLEGDFWTIMSAFLFGVHMLRSEHHSKHLAHDAALPLIGMQLLTITTLYTFWTLYVKAQSGDLASMVSYFNGDWPSALSAAKSVPWLAMIYTGLISTAFCLWIEVVALRDVSATEAAMVYTLEPLYGAGFAWTLLGERWGLKGWIGAALILSGSLASQIFGNETEERPGKARSGQAATALVVLTALVAAAATPRGGGTSSAEAAELAARQAAYLADSIDIDNFATLLRIYALTKMEERDDNLSGQSTTGNVE